MFSELGRFVVTTALVCTAGAAVGARAGATPEVAPARVWGPSVTLSDPSWYQYPADSAVSSAGDMAVVWETDGTVQVAQRPAGGVWSDTENVAKDASSPRLDHDGHGRLLLAWSEKHPGKPARVKVRAHTPGVGWGRARIIAHRTTGVLAVNDLDVNAKGEAVVAWQWNSKGLVSRGSTTGTWSTGLRVPNCARMHVALGDGGLAAAMVQRAIRQPYDAADLVFQVARQPRGGSWGNFKVLQTLRDFGPPRVGPGGVSVDAAGRTTVAWQHETANGAWQVRALRAKKGRPWGRTSVVASLQGWTEFPVRVTGNQKGDVLVTYFPSLRGRLLSVHRPSDAGWSAPAVIAGQGSYICDWDAAMDRSGRAVALWSRARGPGYLARGVRVSLMSRNGSWSAPERLTEVKTVDGHARLAAMNHGDVLAVWSQRAGGYDFEIAARTRS